MSFVIYLNKGKFGQFSGIIFNPNFQTNFRFKGWIIFILNWSGYFLGCGGKRMGSSFPGWLQGFTLSFTKLVGLWFRN